MTVSVRAAAAGPPPLTGASMSAMPRAAACFASVDDGVGMDGGMDRDATAGAHGWNELVAHLPACLHRRRRRRRRARSARPTQRRSLLFRAAVSANGASASARRAHSMSGKPDSTMRRAIGPPWLPRPMKPTVSSSHASACGDAAIDRNDRAVIAASPHPMRETQSCPPRRRLRPCRAIRCSASSASSRCRRAS